jgi:crossover junction endodeoxyribonuclease RusA
VNWTLEYEARPWLHNAERSGGTRGIGGHRGRAAKVREWRDAYANLCLIERVPPLVSIRVVARQVCRDRRRADPGNIYPAVKAAVEGLVDADVIPDDTDLYVAAVELAPAVIAGYDALRLELTGEPCDPTEARRRREATVARLVRQYT